MDPRTDLVISRLDRMEDKLDILLSAHWIRMGASVFMSTMFSVVTTLLVIYFTKGGN